MTTHEDKLNIKQFNLGKRDINLKLTEIKNTNEKLGYESDIKKSIESIEELNKWVKSIEKEIKNKLDTTLKEGKKIKVSDIENKYPIFFNIKGKNQYSISLKVPTIKLVVEPKNEYLSNLKDILKHLNEYKGAIEIRQCDINELDYDCHEIALKQLRSIVVYLEETNLDKVKVILEQITKILDELYKNNNNFIIKYMPSFLFEPIKNFSLINKDKLIDN